MKIEFADATFDYLICHHVLEHVPDDAQGMRECFRVLKPGGVLAVSEELIEPEYVPAFITSRWCRRAGFTPVRTWQDSRQLFSVHALRA